MPIPAAGFAARSLKELAVGNAIVDRSLSVWAGKLRDLLRQAADGSITGIQMQRFLEHQDPFTFETSITLWKEFYREVFGIQALVQGSMVPPIPGDKPEKQRLIVVPSEEEVDNKAILSASEKNLGLKLCSLSVFDRAANMRRHLHAYAVWMNAQGDEHVTVIDRLLYELFYKWQTGKTDARVIGYCCCPGTISRPGYIPNLVWMRDYLSAYEIPRN